ncbi:MAG: transposase [Holosporales bacterium]
MRDLYYILQEPFGQARKSVMMNFHLGFNIVLITGIPWRDRPSIYKPWHAIDTRFKRWSEKRIGICSRNL